MSGFALDWLRLREPFDAAARDATLARRLAAAIARQGAPARIIDLAAGSGANLRALAPLLSVDQDWLLIDDDPLLLAAAMSETERWAATENWRCSESDGSLLFDTGAAHGRVRGRRLNLAQSLHLVDFSACDVVTTSAFLDLVSAEWVDRLCILLVQTQRPLFAVLTVDGRCVWHPPLPADAHVQDAFRRHQRSDKGFGPALGGDAVNYIKHRLAAQGYAVSTMPSDWRITAQQPEMLKPMVEGVSAAAGEAEPAARDEFQRWAKQRIEQIHAEELALEVGHLDLLALPGR